MKLYRGTSIAGLALAMVFECVVALQVDLNDAASIKSTASTIAYDMMTYYTGNVTGSQNWQGSPGILPLPYANNGGYYWWEAGGMWGALIDYWYYTGDTSYNDVVIQALVFQSDAPANDFMAQNQTASMGNDDQGFWGMTAMTAAEVNFPAPPSDSKIPGWLALAQGVFNTQAPRWDNSTCAGGMRWQVYPDESGYSYKNSISNGVFFNIGARLALYTGNNTYYEWANTTYSWMARIGLLNETTWFVYDGSDTKNNLNCSQIDHQQWTYNVGIYLHGAANMYNYTAGLPSSDPLSADAPLWKARITGLSGPGVDIFLQDGIMYEPCEAATGGCDSDQRSFKAYLARWMAATTKLAPFTYDILKPKIMSSATAAALQCDGGVNFIGTGAGRQCGLRWTMNSTYDGNTGVGQQMAALEIIQANLIQQAVNTVTNSTGGTSQGDPNAGSTTPGIGPNGLPPIIVTTGDKVGAGFITAFALIFVIAGSWFMVSPEGISDRPGVVSKSPKREWGWGDLGMARRQFQQKGVDRNSIVLEKLNMSGGVMGSERGSGMMSGERGSGFVYGADPHADLSTPDVYGGGGGGGRAVYPSSSGFGTGSGSGLFSASGSRPGSRGVGVPYVDGGSDSRPGSSRGRGPLHDGGVVMGRPAA